MLLKQLSGNASAWLPLGPGKLRQMEWIFSSRIAMSGIDFCADTNFAVYHLGGYPCVRPYVSASLAVSVVTELELLSKPGMPIVEVTAAELYLETCEIIELTAAIKARVIGLRRQYRLKLPDAIVAATAQWLGVPLLTADKGFACIGSLDMILLDPA